jgi:hypothetical protein
LYFDIVACGGFDDVDAFSCGERVVCGIVGIPGLFGKESKVWIGIFVVAVFCVLDIAFFGCVGDGIKCLVFDDGDFDAACPAYSAIGCDFESLKAEVPCLGSGGIFDVDEFASGKRKIESFGFVR